MQLHVVFTIVGSGLEIAAIAYAARKLWLEPAKREADGAVDWFRRLFRRNRHRVHVDAGTVTMSGAITGMHVIPPPYPTAPDAQIAWLKSRTESLMKDVEALRLNDGTIAAEATANTEAIATALRAEVDEQFRLTELEQGLIGAALIVGVILTLIGGLL